MYNILYYIITGKFLFDFCKDLTTPLVSQKKVLPHVLYCTIWRYPELKNHHELRPLPCCAYSYNAKKDEVCINPYHYERIRQATVPPVLVPRLASQ